MKKVYTHHMTINSGGFNVSDEEVIGKVVSVNQVS